MRRLQDAGEDRGRSDADADLGADLADRGRRLLQVPARVVQAARGLPDRRQGLSPRPPGGGHVRPVRDAAAGDVRRRGGDQHEPDQRRLPRRRRDRRPERDVLRRGQGRAPARSATRAPRTTRTRRPTRRRPPQRKEIIGASVIVSSIGLRACTRGRRRRASTWASASTSAGARTARRSPTGPSSRAARARPRTSSRQASSRAAAVSSQARRGFRVGRGVPFVNLRIEGPGGPQVVVRGPGGRRVTTRAGAPALTAGHAFAVRPEENLHLRPDLQAGARALDGHAPARLDDHPGPAGRRPPEADRPRARDAGAPRSAPALLAAAAAARPASTSLRARHGRRPCTRLRTVSQRRGKLRFKPALGLGRRRQIVAVVESRGMPRASLDGRALPGAARQPPLAPERVDV